MVSEMMNFAYLARGKSKVLDGISTQHPALNCIMIDEPN